MSETVDLAADLKQFATETERFIAGSLPVAEYRALRVPRGIYEQRDGRYMLRVRLPAGVVDPAQMRAMAAAARTHGSGLLHATTRQDIQVHDVPLDRILPALESLLKAGLSTKGGGGNTVRNVVVCQDAGVGPDELFDVSPWATAAMKFLLGFPGSYRMPRKYKMAFSGGAGDGAGAQVNDLGFIARMRDGRPGFAVYAGGGMGPHPRIGDLIEEFIPAAEAHWTAEAVRRVFDRHGNRRNKHRARLRYLVEERGPSWFRERYAAELAAVKAEFPALLEAPSVVPPPARLARSAEPPGDGFAAWRRNNVRRQKQPGTFMAEVHTFLGDLHCDVFEKLADAVEAHGDGCACITASQHMLLRWLREEELPALHRRLADLGLAGAPQAPVGRIVACKGAATCKLGICLSQGLARAIRDEIEDSGLVLEGSDVTVYVNGCPNSCGRHPVASIGLTGSARRVGGALVPHYLVQLGGRLGEGRARFAEGSAAVPARLVPAFLVRFLRAFRESAQYPGFDAFLDAGGRRVAEDLAGSMPPGDAASLRRDWGGDSDFSLAGRGPGECGAGVFDLIELDLAEARDALKRGDARTAVERASRALLVTRGEEARDAAEAIALFDKHFVQPGFIPVGLQDRPADLVAAVEKLYASLDASLQLPAPAVAAPSDMEADYRGVTCPLNYVKTKMALARLKPGQVLTVLLDEAGARNVPPSVQGDGHEVLSSAAEGGSWRVRIRKR